MHTHTKDELLLTQLVLMFQTAAMQHMGKLRNPLTGTIERDLGQAQISIDILEMLHTKTRGNLSADEERMLTDVLKELRLNYVDEQMKDERASAPSSETTKST